MVAGLMAVAAANAMVIAHSQAHSSAARIWQLFGGPLLYLLAQGWYRAAVPQVRPRFQLIGSAVLVVVGLAALAAPPYVALLLVEATLTAALYLTRTTRRLNQTLAG